MNELKQASDWWAVDLLDVEKNYPEYHGKVEQAVEVMDGLGLLVDRGCRVEIWSGGGGGAHGSYDPGGRLIRVFEDSVVAGYCEMTVCHEYGHHLSLPLGETEYEFMDRVWGSPIWSAWWKTVKSTEVYKKLRALESNEREPWSVRDYAGYLNDPREVFARCFSQWVALRSGVVELWDQHLGALVDTGGIFGWDAGEFEAIGVAMDSLVPILVE